MQYGFCFLRPTSVISGSLCFTEIQPYNAPVFSRREAEPQTVPTANGCRWDRPSRASGCYAAFGPVMARLACCAILLLALQATLSAADVSIALIDAKAASYLQEQSSVRSEENVKDLAAIVTSLLNVPPVRSIDAAVSDQAHPHIFLVFCPAPHMCAC